MNFFEVYLYLSFCVVEQRVTIVQKAADHGICNLYSRFVGELPTNTFIAPSDYSNIHNIN